MSIQPGFWDDPEEAERIMREIRSRKAWTNSYEQVKAIYDDLATLWEFLELGGCRAKYSLWQAPTGGPGGAVQTGHP